MTNVAVKADTALFETFIGVFKYKECTIITITLKNGKLYVEAIGDAKYELCHCRITNCGTGLNAKLTFEKDASGKVTPFM